MSAKTAAEKDDPVPDDDFYEYEDDLVIGA